MKRRELFQLGAAALALPAEGFSAAAQVAVKDPGWRPQLFDAHQNETVIAFTETLIPATDTPGAKAALVNRYLDLILAEAHERNRVVFLDGIAVIDAVAQRRGAAAGAAGRPFVKLSEAEQIALLKDMESGGEGETAKAAIQFLKGWTARVYYSTEIGFKELNKGGRVPASYGCAHPEQHA